MTLPRILPGASPDLRHGGFSNVRIVGIGKARLCRDCIHHNNLLAIRDASRTCFQGCICWGVILPGGTSAVVSECERGLFEDREIIPAEFMSEIPASSAQKIGGLEVAVLVPLQLILISENS